MTKGIIFGMVLLTLFAIPAMASEVYLDPQDSGVECYCKDTTVEIWADLTDPCVGGTIDMRYDSACANVTAFESNAADWAWGFTWDDTIAGKEWITFMHSSANTGKVLIGTLTIHCENEEGCTTPLEFVVGVDNSILSDEAFAPLANVSWINGTFTCGEPEQCLGWCYEGTVCDGTPIGKMNCSECLAVAGRSWLNDPCPVSACGCTCDSMCWNHSIGCPECCDGIDNDGVNGTDWPADPKCACCIDQTETVDDGCSTPCVPELPTLALTGIGILGIALLARKRD